jgi:hypothetical protein
MDVSGEKREERKRGKRGSGKRGSGKWEEGRGEGRGERGEDNHKHKGIKEKRNREPFCPHHGAIFRRLACLARCANGCECWAQDRTGKWEKQWQAFVTLVLWSCTEQHPKN